MQMGQLTHQCLDCGKYYLAVFGLCYNFQCLCSRMVASFSAVTASNNINVLIFILSKVHNCIDDSRLRITERS